MEEGQHPYYDQNETKLRVNFKQRIVLLTENFEHPEQQISLTLVICNTTSAML